MFIKFENVAFNAKWAASKSFEEFKKHEGHNGLSDEKLREAHNLCKEAVKPKAVEKPAEPAK